MFGDEECSCRRWLRCNATGLGSLDTSSRTWRCPLSVMWVVIAVGAGDGAGDVVDAEVVAVELVVAEVRVACERPGFDQDPMLGVGESGERVAGPVSGIGEHIEPCRVRWRGA